MYRRSLPIAAFIVGAAGGVPVLSALLPGLPMNWGWAYGGHTPMRQFVVPVAFWLLVGAYVLIARRSQPLGVAASFAYVLIIAAGIELPRELVTLRSTPFPDPSRLNSLDLAYVRLATPALLGVAGALAGEIVRRRAVVLSPIVAAIAIALLRESLAGDVIGILAIAVGVVGAFGLGRLQPRLRRPPMRWHLVALAAVLILTFAVRMAFVLSVVRANGLDYPRASDDGPSYDELAWLLASGLSSEVDRTHLYFSSYVLLISAIYSIVGHSFILLGAIQAMFAVATAWLTYWFCRRITEPVAALIAGLAVAVNMTLVQLSVLVGTEALVLPLVTASFILVWRAVEAPSPRERVAWGVAAGLAMGLCAVTRDVMLGLPILIIAWSAWALRRRLGSWSSAAGPLIALMLFVSLVYFPFAIYRDRFAFAGSYLVPTAYGLGHPDLQALGIGPENGVGGSLAIAAARPVEAGAALLKETWTKFDMLMLSSEYGAFDLVFLVQQTGYARVAEIYFTAIIVVGLWLLATRRTIPIETRVLLLLLPLYGIVAHVVLFHANAAMRYRAPYDPVFAIALGIAVTSLAQSVRASAAKTGG